MADASNESRREAPEGTGAPADAARSPAARREPKVEEKPTEDAALGTPHEHALATGNTVLLAETVRMGGGRPGERLTYSLAHAAAARLHGWGAHEYHENAPIRITRAAYLAALKAALEPDETGIYWPHAAALSKHAPAGTPDPSKRPKPKANS
ncbi:MAG: hypothetical protein DIU78_009805 [Pseudomonadota bacterium]|nr:MAG: hypothetical protein DIU78_22935 [Pseudomonadota bacterium]